MAEMNFKNKFSIFIRSFFIQGAWNYLRFQNFGYLFTVKNYLRKIYPNALDFKNAALRHFGIFNTQPYMASFVIGNVLKLEEENFEDKEEKINQIKHSLACAYASIGDRIFWSRLRILVFEITVFLFILFFAPFDFQRIIKVIAFSIFVPTLLYAFFSVYIRWKGLELGYACGGKELCGLDAINWNKLIKFSSLIAFGFSIFIFLFMFFVFFYSFVGESFSRIIFPLITFLFAIFSQRYFKSKNKTLIHSIIAVIVFSFLINFLEGLL